MLTGFQNVNILPHNVRQYEYVIVLLHFKNIYFTIGALFAVSKSIYVEPTTWGTLFESQKTC